MYLSRISKAFTGLAIAVGISLALPAATYVQAGSLGTSGHKMNRAPLVIIGSAHSNLPSGTTYGDCGYASFYIINENNGGYPNFLMEAYSTLGAIETVHYHVYWNNETFNFHGAVDSNSYPFGGGGNYWELETPVYTATGKVYGQFTGSVVTSQTTCMILGPTDTRYVY